ncbi:MAG: hypothetical protein LRY62_02365 [Alphaproteobacteria bacterium]|nr:hypothetical protein [Alphaproteobacteria bacterium]
MQIDHNEISQIMREVAADKIIPRFQKLADGEIRTKSGPEDLVTIADEEAEVEITKRLQAAYPGCYVLGEESVAQGTVSRDILKTSNTLIFIVDPVDGTRNFAHGVPRYGSIVAAVYNGECIGGWIYQIPLDRIFHAEKGKGVMIDGVPFTPAAQPAPDADFSVMRAFISTMFVPSAYGQWWKKKPKCWLRLILTCAVLGNIRPCWRGKPFSLSTPALNPGTIWRALYCSRKRVSMCGNGMAALIRGMTLKAGWLTRRHRSCGTGCMKRS